jgi:spore cortex formation protein SpoVR/YcgB (stage V sporulation)
VFSDVWRTVPGKRPRERVRSADQRRAVLGLPEENVLRFVEKTAPRLQPWQREILAIVRRTAQYFYAQRQTKLMNEGCATFVHHRVMTRLHENGLIDDGAFLEFLHSHSNVVAQPGFDDRRYGGINPYALGYAMMTDIERICREPADEDRAFAPEIAGRPAYEALREIWSNYRDESFVAQFLSPAVIRKHELFLLRDEEKEDALVVRAIHNEDGYRDIRRALSATYDIACQDMNLTVVDADLAGDRVLELEHTVSKGVVLDRRETEEVLSKLADLWSYPVRLREMDGERVCNEYTATPKRPFH